MRKFTGFTTKTAERLLLDAGAFYKNYDVATDTVESAATKLIGATQGGGSFTVTPTIRSIECDGVAGEVKGLKTIDTVAVSMVLNVLEVTPDTLKLALGTGRSEVSSSPSGGYKKVTMDNIIADGDYLENITWIGRISGQNNPCIIVVKNALSTNGLALTFADAANGVIPITITGHYTADDMETVPFEIYYPESAE